MATPQEAVTPPAEHVEPKLDSWGRYLIPDPESKVERPWQRVTTFARMMSGQELLTKHKIRTACYGVARNNGIRAAIASIRDPRSQDSKTRLNQLCERAAEAAGSDERALLGDALHRYCESLDLGHEVIAPEHEADLRKYRELLAEHELKVSPHWVEKVVLLPEVGVAGTLDRVVERRGKRHVMDLKTGEFLDFAWLDIAIQQACYTRGRYTWDPVIEKHGRMIKVDQDVAFICHLPAGQPERAEIYALDIKRGWEAAQDCALVRDWRKVKDFATPLKGS